MSTEHALDLGRLVGNFLSLELALRHYLYHASHPSGEPKASRSIFDLEIGEKVPVTPFTNYDSLGQLVKKYNDQLPSSLSELKVDSSVIEIRDLIAHGRAAAEVEDTRQLKIVKFGRESNGMVALEGRADMTDEWFKSVINLVGSQTKRVSTATESLPGFRASIARAKRKD